MPTPTPGLKSSGIGWLFETTKHEFVHRHDIMAMECRYCHLRIDGRTLGTADVFEQDKLRKLILNAGCEAVPKPKKRKTKLKLPPELEIAGHQHDWTADWAALRYRCMSCHLEVSEMDLADGGHAFTRYLQNVPCGNTLYEPRTSYMQHVCDHCGWVEHPVALKEFSVIRRRCITCENNLCPGCGPKCAMTHAVDAQLVKTEEKLALDTFVGGASEDLKNLGVAMNDAFARKKRKKKVVPMEDPLAPKDRLIVFEGE